MSLAEQLRPLIAESEELDDDRSRLCRRIAEQGCTDALLDQTDTDRLCRDRVRRACVRTIDQKIHHDRITELAATDRLEPLDLDTVIRESAEVPDVSIAEIDALIARHRRPRCCVEGFDQTNRWKTLVVVLVAVIVWLVWTRVR